MLVGLGLVEDGAGEFVREEFHIGKMAGIVVGIFVAIGISKLFHKLCRGVSDGEGDRKVTCLFYQRQGLFYGQIRAVALRGRCKINRGLRQGNPAFRHANLGHHLKAGICQQQGIGIGKAHIFRCRQAQATRDEQRIFPAVNHPGKVINGSIGVRSANTLYKGGNNVVMHFPVLIVNGHVLLDGLRHKGVIDDDGVFPRLRINYYFKNIQKLAGISAAVAHKGFGFLYLYVFLFKEYIFLQSMLQKRIQVFFVQGLKDKNLAAGQKGSNNLE